MKALISKRTVENGNSDYKKVSLYDITPKLVA